MPRPAVKKAAALEAQREIVKIHVRFTLNTADGLRRVLFDLEKDSLNAGEIDWKIQFQVFERVKKSEAFGDPLVDLELDVDTKLNKQAETIANDGMTPSQAAFAIGPAADTAKDAKTGAADDDEARATVLKTLKK